MTNKGSMATPIMTVIAVIIIIALAYFAFTTIWDNISGPTASQQMNVTAAMGNTVFNVGGIVLVIASILIIIGILYYWVSSPERFKKPSKVYEFLVDSCYYFSFGLLGIVIVAVPTYLIYFLYNYTVVEGNVGAFFEIGKWLLIAVVAFFGIAGIGYAFKKKFIDKLMERRKELDYESNIKELPKVN